MPRSQRRQKWKRRLLIIFGGILVLTATISILADRIIDGIIRNALNDAEATFYGITYRLEVGNINTSLVGRSVGLHDVLFLPADTSLLDQKKDTVQMMVRFDKLRMVDMDIRQLYYGDSLDIGLIELKGAEVEIFVNMDQLYPNDLQFVPNVKEIFARNAIGSLLANDALVRVKVVERNVTHRTFIEPMDLRIDRPITLQKDSLGRARFSFQHFEMEAEKMLIDLDNGYRVQTAAFLINSSDSTVQVSNLDIRPKKGTPKVLKGKVRTFDWSIVSASQIHAEGFEMLNLLQNDGFQAERVILKDPHLYMYQSLFVLDSLENVKAKRLPGAIIHDMERRFMIDHLELSNGLIEYEEVYDTIADPLYFSVGDIKLVLKNFTPRKEFLARNDILDIEFSAVIMDSVNVRSTMSVPILSSNAQFNFIGHVDALDLTMFNPIMEGERIKFKSGYMNALDMEFRADLERSIGTMDMDFSNLHLQVLKKEKVLPIRLTQHNMLVSFLFNKFVKTNNSREKKNFRQGVINVQRDPSANFLTYIYESTIAGAISSMTGIDDSMSNRFPEIESAKSKKKYD